MMKDDHHLFWKMMEDDASSLLLFFFFSRDSLRKLHGNIECFNVYHGEHKNVLVCKNKPKKTQKHKKINPHLRKTKEMMKECSEDDEKKQKRDDAHNFATD